MKSFNGKRAEIIELQNLLVQKNVLLSEIQADCIHEKVIRTLYYDGNGTTTTCARCLVCGLDETASENGDLKTLRNRPTKLLSNKEWGQQNSLLKSLFEIDRSGPFISFELS